MHREAGDARSFYIRCPTRELWSGSKPAPAMSTLCNESDRGGTFECRGHIDIIRNVIAEVGHRRREERRDPDRSYTERARHIVQLGRDSPQIAHTVSVGVEEAAWIDLIDDSGLPPFVAHRSKITPVLNAGLCQIRSDTALAPVRPWFGEANRQRTAFELRSIEGLDRPPRRRTWAYRRSQSPWNALSGCRRSPNWRAPCRDEQTSSRGRHRSPAMEDWRCTRSHRLLVWRPCLIWSHGLMMNGAVRMADGWPGHGLSGRNDHG